MFKNKYLATVLAISYLAIPTFIQTQETPGVALSNAMALHSRNTRQLYNVITTASQQTPTQLAYNFMHALHNVVVTGAELQQQIASKIPYNSICEKMGNGTYGFASLMLSCRLTKVIHDQFQFLVRSFDTYEKDCTKNTDSRFKDWVLHVIHSHENNPMNPIISVTNTDPQLQSHVTRERSVKISIQHVLSVPQQFQTHVLSHLEENHTCTAQCEEVINKITAIIDHEYAHAKHNHVFKRTVCAGLATIGFVKLFSHIHAQLKSHSSLLYAITPLITYYATVSLRMKYFRAQEQQADENIYNDYATLTGGKQFFQDMNNALSIVWVTRPHLRSRIDMQRENGNFLTFLSTHPPFNQRIARLQERIDMLKKAESNP